MNFAIGKYNFKRLNNKNLFFLFTNFRTVHMLYVFDLVLNVQLLYNKIALL